MSDSSAQPSVGLWTEHINPEGRTYWNNSVTKQSVWEKPEELKTPFEKALADTQWKEYVSKGRKYWVHKETKESVWNMPDELLELLEKVDAPQSQPRQPMQITMNPAQGPPLEITATSQVLGLRPNPAPVQSLPEAPVERYVIPERGWPTHEMAVEAFEYLLQKSGVELGWTWDQVLRTIITDPLYKSLNTLAEKKEAFTNYIANSRARAEQERDARLARVRPAIRRLLGDHASIKSYSTFPNAEKLFATNKVWRDTKDEDERRMLFEEHIKELKDKEATVAQNLKAANKLKIDKLIRSLPITVFTRWREAHDMVLQSEEWYEDAVLRECDPIDILESFESFNKELEREYDTTIKKSKIERSRKARRSRTDFKALLKELVDAGNIKSKTQWKSIFPLIKDDERYEATLGMTGSSALDLFMDAVDELDRQVEDDSYDIRDAFHKSGKAIEMKTTFGDFSKDLDGVDGWWNKKELGNERKQAIYTFLHDRAVTRHTDDLRRAERKLRHQIEDLRYALKKVEPPLDLEAAYEDVASKLKGIKEFDAMDGQDEERKGAWEKFVKRQKEKLRERELDEVGDDHGGSPGSPRRRRESHRDGPRDSRRATEEDRDGDRRGDSRKSKYDDSRDRDRFDRDRGEKRSERESKRPKLELEEGEI